MTRKEKRKEKVTWKLGIRNYELGIESVDGRVSGVLKQAAQPSQASLRSASSPGGGAKTALLPRRGAPVALRDPGKENTHFQ